MIPRLPAMSIDLPRLALAALGVAAPGLACGQGFLPGDWRVACDARACTVSYGYSCEAEEMPFDGGQAVLRRGNADPASPSPHSSGRCGWMSSTRWKGRDDCEWIAATRWAWNGREFTRASTGSAGRCIAMPPDNAWESAHASTARPPMNAT
jgi:hypothetical protein